MMRRTDACLGNEELRFLRAMISKYFHLREMYWGDCEYSDRGSMGTPIENLGLLSMQYQIRKNRNFSMLKADFYLDKARFPFSAVLDLYDRLNHACPDCDAPITEYTGNDDDEKR